MKHWQTTAQSVLTVVIAVAGLLVASPQPWMNAKASLVIMAIGGIAKVTLGVLQKDAPVEGESK